MHKILLAIFMPLLAAVPCLALDCSDVVRLLPETAELRGLAPKRDVICEMLDRAQYQERKEKQFAKVNTAEQIKNEGIVYKLLGLIPVDYDYEKCMLKSAKNDVLPFYSILERKIILPAWKDNPDDILVHELVHALQDQHYNIQSYGHGRAISLDVYLATSALIEGDATLVQERFNERRKQSESLLKAEEAGLEADLQCKLPGALVDLYDFPYGFGRILVSRLLQNDADGKALDKAFRYPPRTSKEVLHRSVYEPAKNLFFKPHIPPLQRALSAQKNARLVFSDQLGQYVTRLVLRSLPDKQAILAAKGWKGDALGLYEDPSSQEMTLMWRSFWENEQEASEFLLALKAVFGQRFGMSFANPAKELCYFNETRGSFLLKQEDNEVLLTSRKGTKNEALLCPGGS